MKSYAVFSVLLIIVCVLGCSKQMPNKEIIEEVQRCEAAGLDAVAVNQGLHYGEVTSIQCAVPFEQRHRR